MRSTYARQNSTIFEQTLHNDADASAKICMGHVVARAACCALKCVQRVAMIQGLGGNNIDIHVALGVGKMLGLHVGGVADNWSYSGSLYCLQPSEIA